jgi:hypothetical protein
LRFYTDIECEEWLKGRNRIKPNGVEDTLALRLPYPHKPYRVYSIAHWIATQVTYRMPTLLWVTEWGIWSSSENWHLYYRLRQSQGDHRLLEESPGHLFLEYEAEELTSFLQVAMLNGWGGYVLTHADYVNAFFSHDEFVDFYSKDQSLLDDVRKALVDEKDLKSHQVAD